MLRLYLRDIETGLTVERDNGADTLTAPALTLSWSMKDAVGELTNKVAERSGKTPQEILFSDRTPYEIYAVWEAG